MRSLTARRAILVTLSLALAGAAWAGENISQSGGFSTAVGVFPGACPVKDIRPLESTVPVPAYFSLEMQSIQMFCQVRTSKGSGTNRRPVKKVKGTYTTDLITRDNNTGEVESVPLSNGRIKTDRDGFSNFDFDIPSELFADGFESGDVSAWSYTRTDFTNKKKVNNVSLGCGVSASSSGGN